MGMRGAAVAVGLGGLIVAVAGLVVGSPGLVRQGAAAAFAGLAGYVAFAGQATERAAARVRWPLAGGLGAVALGVALTGTAPVLPARAVPLLAYAALVLAVAGLPVYRRPRLAVAAPAAFVALLGYVALLSWRTPSAVLAAAVPLTLAVLALAGATLAAQRVPMVPTVVGMLLLAVPPLLSVAPAVRAASFVLDARRAQLGAFLQPGMHYLAAADGPAVPGPGFGVPGPGPVAGVAWLAGLLLVVAGCLRARA